MATILIIDDLSANRLFLVTLLRHQGHRMLEAADGKQGLAMTLAAHPDLVITDVLMPVMDGYELLRQLRLDPATSAIPVVFYTAHYGEKEARALASSSGVAYVLTKPSRSEEVLRIVGLALAGESETPGPPDSPALSRSFQLEHLRLLTDQLSEKAGDLRIANAKVRALINIGLGLASERDPALLLQNVCVATGDLFGATYVSLAIIGQTEPTVEQYYTSGAVDFHLMAIGDSIPAMLEPVVRERRTLRGINPSGDRTSINLPRHHADIQNFLVAPVASPTRVYGWLFLGSEGRAFTDSDEELVRALSGQVGRIYENAYFSALAQRRATELEYEILERRQAEAALGKSESLIRNLVEHLPHRILVKDRNSVILFCNVNYSQDLGLPPEAVIGKDAYDFYPREVAAAYHADDREVMDRGILKDVEEPYEADGQHRWVHTVKVPYHDEQGAVTGILVVFEDITERKLLEEQFRQSQKMEAVGRLAGGIAHDFNNLLTAILGYCELLLADIDSNDSRQADIAEIQKAGLSAARLTRQLLAFSRKQIIEPTLLDLNKIVANMQTMLGRLIGEDVKVMLHLRLGLNHVRADRGQVEQIVMNLAVNARDAMPHGGVLTIETANVELDENYARTHLAAKPGSYVVLTVTDSGTGMTAEVQARLFEPFFTTKSVGKGTGLGLATVHGIVTQSEGSVNVYSEVGKGTSFKVYFPRAQQSDVVVEEPLLVASARAGTQTVLVVEDADELRVLTKRLLERQGYKVLVAANAAEAVALFEQDAAIDVLLTDVVMPGASGPELTRQLVERWPMLKVVYMSGYTEEAIIHHGVLNPGIAFLHKPFTSDTLALKIREALDRPSPGRSGPVAKVTD